MKVIDLLNKMARGEQLPNKILIRDVVYYLINDTYGNIVYSQTTDEKNWESFIDNRLIITRCLNEDVLILDTGVEISEEHTIDIDSIEEIKWRESEKEHLFEEDFTLYNMKILVNLITKLQKENETIVKLNANMSKRHLNDIFKIKKLQKENKEKAEQIDLMADKINEAYFDENDFYTWFKEIFGIIPKGNYKDKIKQYFEQLAKEKE